MSSEPNVQPFGLHFATSAVQSIPVELPELSYDRRHQTTVVDTPTFPATGTISSHREP